MKYIYSNVVFPRGRLLDGMHIHLCGNLRMDVTTEVNLYDNCVCPPAAALSITLNGIEVIFASPLLAYLRTSLSTSMAEMQSVSFWEVSLCSGVFLFLTFMWLIACIIFKAVINLEWVRCCIFSCFSHPSTAKVMHTELSDPNLLSP